MPNMTFDRPYQRSEYEKELEREIEKAVDARIAQDVLIDEEMTDMGSGTTIVLGGHGYPISYTAGADNATVVQAAIDEVASRGGGVVELSEKFIPISTVEIKKLVTIRGKGWHTGFIGLSGNNTALGLFTVHQIGISGGHTFYADRFKFRDFAIYGNKANISAGVTTAAFYLDASDGYFGNNSVPDTGDPAADLMSGNYVDMYATFKNIKISQCPGKGIEVPVASVGTQRAMVLFFDTIVLLGCDGDGLHVNSSDNLFTNIKTGGHGGHGIYLNGGNMRMSNSKSYFGGYDGGKSGIYLDSSCTGCSLSAVESQEQIDIGFTLSGCNNVSLIGAISEGHGHDGVSEFTAARTYDGVGFVFDGCSGCYVQGTSNSRSVLYGDMQYMMKWLTASGTCRFNTVDLVTNSPNSANLSRPTPNIYDQLPPLTNRLILNGLERHLPNMVKKIERISGPVATNGAVKNWQFANQSGMSATVSLDTTELCQKIVVGKATSTTAGALLYIEFPIALGDKISLAAEGKCNYGLKFRISANVYSGSPTTSTYTDNFGGNFITPTFTGGGTWDWSVTTPYTVTSALTFMRVQFNVLAVATGTYTLNAWFKSIMVTNVNEFNEKEVWKWSGGSPSGEFVPLFEGQKYLNTAAGTFYMGNGTATTTWAALN